MCRWELVPKEIAKSEPIVTSFLQCTDETVERKRRDLGWVGGGAAGEKVGLDAAFNEPSHLGG